MAKEKKKLSKNAKTAAKLLENSKLLTASKASNDLKMSQAPKPTGVSAKTNAPNKMRPEKKRG
jgi:hypothetical protein